MVGNTFVFLYAGKHNSLLSLGKSYWHNIAMTGTSLFLIVGFGLSNFLLQLGHRSVLTMMQHTAQTQVLNARANFNVSYTKKILLKIKIVC